MWYAELLSKIGRYSEAADEARIGRELDPVSLGSNTMLGMVLYRAGRYDEAIEACRRALELDPRHASALWFTALAHEEKGDLRQAISELSTAVSLSSAPLYRALLGHAYGLAGDRTKALQMLETLTAESRTRYISPVDIALIHTGLGDRDSAFAWLEKAYQERTMRIQESHDEIRPDHVAGVHRLLLCIGVRGGSHPTASHVMLTNVPELPEVEFVRRRLAPVMARKRFERVSVRRPDLRLPFPVRFSARLTGETALAVRRRAKYLLVPLSSGETLLMHLGMSGSFRIERHLREPDDPRHDHVVFHMSSGAVVTFNDPRRFGFMDLLAADALATHPVLSRLGPEPLSAEFDAFVLARACKDRKTPLKIALPDQRVVAGLGNIYAAEALHVARLSPNRRASTIATASGAPRESARRLAAAIKQVLTEAIDRQSKAVYRSARFRVYDREAEPCRRGRCGGTIRRRTQAGRSTFFCPVCQR